MRAAIRLGIVLLSLWLLRGVGGVAIMQSADETPDAVPRIGVRQVDAGFITRFGIRIECDALFTL